MARNYERYISPVIAAQASAAIVADSDSTGTTVDFNKVALANLDGCQRGEVEIDVTVAPATAARCIVYLQGLENDGVGYSAKQRVGSIAIETTAKKYKLVVDIEPEKGKIFLHAVDYAFTASAGLKGVYDSDV